jgi:TusA-related sulfurtransferase
MSQEMLPPGVPAPDAVCDGGDLEVATGLLMILRGAMDRVPPGGVLEVQSREPGVAADLPSWCRMTGHEFLGSAAGDGCSRYFVRRSEKAALAAADWGVRVPLRRGRELDTADWFVGRVGDVPKRAAQETGFAPRGSIVEPDAPPFAFQITDRDKVWAANIAELYEQATANQWDASRDVPWHELKPLPDDLERAVCQIMTFLVENEYSALYVPAKFMPRIHPAFAEVVMFLATQTVDEARHIEAFTKRALANGGGLQYSAASTQLSLKTLFDQEDFSSASFLLSVLGEGTFLDLLSFIETFAPDPVTAYICRRARQDETRHVHFGMAHTKYHLTQNPASARPLIDAVRARAAFMDAVTGVNPFVQESLAVLAAGGSAPENLPRGIDEGKKLYAAMHENRMKRLIQAGFSDEQAREISELHTPNFM